MSLDPLADGFVPQIDQGKALQLAYQQLGPGAAPTAAEVYLGDDAEGAPVWVVTYEGVCGAPNLGPSDDGLPECLDDTLSIALDANTGDFVVAW